MITAKIRRPFRMWQRNFDVFKSHFLASIVGNIVEPVLALFALGVGLGALVREIDGMSYLQFLAPGMMAAAAMNAAAMECSFGAYTRMVEQKVYDGILATPLSIYDIVLGEILWGATKGLISSMIMLAILTIIGLFDQFAMIPLIILNMFALSASFSIIALSFSAIAKSYEFFNYFFTLFLTPMLFFSDIYFPIKQIPEWFASFFYIFPSLHSVTINRFLFHGGDSEPTLIASLYLILFIPFGAMAASWFVSRRMIPSG